MEYPVDIDKVLDIQDNVSRRLTDVVRTIHKLYCDVAPVNKAIHDTLIKDFVLPTAI